MRKEGSRHRNKKKRKASAERRRNRHKLHPDIACEGEGEGEGGVDRISQLPNEILISIISRLTLREATSTSILSSRWRYLYTYITHLIFPNFEPKVYSTGLSEFQHTRFRNHVNRINRVLDSHNGGGIVKELKLHMYNMEGGSIKKWFEFAFTKETEIIDIAMLQAPYLWPQRFYRRYSFGLSRLILSKPLLPSRKSLKQLTLVNVEVTNQDFDLLVSNFLALETLCLQCARRSKFKKVSIVGHPNLKHFDIDVPSMIVESLEIRNVMNLLSLRIYNLGHECALRLENIPKLAKLCTNEKGNCTYRYNEVFAGIIPSCIRDQLQLLRLSTDLYYRPLEGVKQQAFQFVNMKQLELVLGRTFRPFMLVHQLYPLLEACIWLEKLKIKFQWSSPEWIQMWDREVPRYYHSSLKKLSPNLKVLEIEQYLGCQADLQLAAYVIYNAVNLEQVTVVACDETKRIRRRALARAREDFEKITPPSIHLRIT